MMRLDDSVLEGKNKKVDAWSGKEKKVNEFIFNLINSDYKLFKEVFKEDLLPKVKSLVEEMYQDSIAIGKNTFYPIKGQTPDIKLGWKEYYSVKKGPYCKEEGPYHKTTTIKLDKILRKYCETIGLKPLEQEKNKRKIYKFLKRIVPI